MLGLHFCEGFSLVVESGPFIRVACLVVEQRLQGVWVSVVVAHGLSSCRFQALEHRLNSYGSQLSCSMAYGIFPDQILNLSCIGRQILYHGATKETLLKSFLKDASMM